MELVGGNDTCGIEAGTRCRCDGVRIGPFSVRRAVPSEKGSSRQSDRRRAVYGLAFQLTSFATKIAPPSPKTAVSLPFSSPYRPHPPRTPQESPPKPIYIYPGLLRIFRDKAIAPDNQCPAVHYKCRECCKDQKTTAADRQVPPGNDDITSVASAAKITEDRRR